MLDGRLINPRSDQPSADPNAQLPLGSIPPQSAVSGSNSTGGFARTQPTTMMSRGEHAQRLRKEATDHSITLQFLCQSSRCCPSSPVPNPKPPSISIPAFAPAPMTKPTDNGYSTPYVALSTTAGPPAHLSVKVNNAPSDPIQRCRTQVGHKRHSPPLLSPRAQGENEAMDVVEPENEVTGANAEDEDTVSPRRSSTAGQWRENVSVYSSCLAPASTSTPPTRTNPTTTRRKSNMTKATRTAYADSDMLALPYGGVVHAGCLAPWFRSHTTCPTCRFDNDQPRRRRRRSDGYRECRECGRKLF